MKTSATKTSATKTIAKKYIVCHYNVIVLEAYLTSSQYAKLMNDGYTIYLSK